MIDSNKKNLLFASFMLQFTAPMLSSTQTTCGNYLWESIIVMLTPKSGIQGQLNLHAAVTYAKK